jgi:hypothetical protein
MNIKRLCLIASLLGLPVAYSNANAGEVIIRVPVELTNVPAAIRQVRVNCWTGVGNDGSTRSFGVSAAFNIPENRNYSGAVDITVSGSRVDAATNYNCDLQAWPAGPGQPALPGINKVSGVISR